MNLSYLRMRKEGRQEGVEREGRAMIESIMQVRFGQVDSQLQTISNPPQNLQINQSAKIENWGVDNCFGICYHGVDKEELS